MRECIKIVGIGMIAAVCLLCVVGMAATDPIQKIPDPIFKPLRPEKRPFDPDSLPDPFLSYIVGESEQAAKAVQEEAKAAQEEEEKLAKEKQAAAQKLKELLVVRTELQKLTISQLTLTAIVEAGRLTWAMVRDPKGRGFILKEGTRIGANGGVVHRIVRGEKKVIIKEPYLEDELYLKFKDVEMKLPDQDYESEGK